MNDILNRPLEDWCAPLPMKRSSFVSLHPRDQVFNVETDLGQIKSFFRPRHNDSGLLAHADLQSSPDVNDPGRLGSGRAVFFRGRYLKGVGRTSLAINWCDESDAYHGSGHLSAMAGAREYLVSCFLDAHGAGHHIVHCSGLLARDIPPDERCYARGCGPTSDEFDVPALPECEVSVQSITVKDGGFARSSNFHWLLHHFLPVAPHIARLLEQLVHYAGPGGSRSGSGSIDAQAIVDAIRGSIERGFSAFAAFFELGVTWGSVHNNYTLDGRFLDLENAVVTGSSAAAVLDLVPLPPRTLAALRSGAAGELMGAETLLFARHARYWVGGLATRLRQICEFVARDRSTAYFLADVADRLEASILGDGPLEHGRVLRRFLDLFSALRGSVQARSTLREFARVEGVRTLEGQKKEEDGPSLPLVDLDLQLAPAEPVVPTRIYGIEGFPKPTLTASAQAYNRGLMRVAECRDATSYLAAVRAAEAEIRESAERRGQCPEMKAHC